MGGKGRSLFGTPFRQGARQRGRGAIGSVYQLASCRSEGGHRDAAPNSTNLANNPMGLISKAVDKLRDATQEFRPQPGTPPAGGQRPTVVPQNTGVPFGMPGSWSPRASSTPPQGARPSLAGRVAGTLPGSMNPSQLAGMPPVQVRAPAPGMPFVTRPGGRTQQLMGGSFDPSRHHSPGLPNPSGAPHSFQPSNPVSSQPFLPPHGQPTPVPGHSVWGAHSPARDKS